MEIMPHFLRMYSSFSIPLRDASRGAGLCIFSQQAEYADERSNAADDPECDEGGIRGSVADGEEELDALRDVALGDELDCAEDFCNREAGECRRQECGEYEDGLEAAAAERMKALDHERECGKRIEDTRQEEEEEVRAVDLVKRFGATPVLNGVDFTIRKGESVALIGDNGNSEKEYLVRVKGSLKENGLALLNHGLSLDGEKLRPAQVSWQNQDQLRFVLKQGKKRQIRRMCELVGLRVVGLKRIRVGRIKLGALPQGKWRYLQANERF